MAHIINFRANFNNKLNCTYFTTVRADHIDSYFEGAYYRINVNRVYLKDALLMRAEKITLSSLDDVFCYYDAGISKTEFMKTMLEWFPHLDVSWNCFVLLLFKTVNQESSKMPRCQCFMDVAR